MKYELGTHLLSCLIFIKHQNDHAKHLKQLAIFSDSLSPWTNYYNKKHKFKQTDINENLEANERKQMMRDT